MKILLLRGGLGNQLFIYGAYQYYSKINVKVRIDDYYGFKNDILYNRQNSLLKFNLPYIRTCINLNFIWPILNFIKDNTSYLFFSNEYFQDSKYLDHIKISFSPIVDRICVHIRLKDYSLKLDENIYLEMLDFVCKENSNIPVFFITDDEEYFSLNMKILYSKGDCKSLSEIDSFHFIAESSHVILSDSSFSFGAAYLGDNKCIVYHRLSNIINSGSKKHKWIRF